MSPSERLDARAAELGVTRHLMLWGAACMLWAEPEHIAYALIEAASREAALDYIASATPPGWSARALPVWNVPEQLPVVRQLLAAPAIARVAPREIAETPSPVESTANREPPAVTPSNGQPAAVRTTTPPASITELLDELDDRQASEAAAESPVVADAESAGLSLLKGETMILESVPTPGPSLRLLATAGPCEGSTFEVGEASAIVGRLPDNPIYVPDSRLSRKHARIEFREDGYWLTDLGSANGTTLNGRSVTTAAPLRAGDVIDLGASQLTVMHEPESRTPTD
jgi:hypothetical protein